MAKRQTTYLILKEYLQNAYTLQAVESRIEEHWSGHKFELGTPFTVTLIPVKGSAFYLLDAGSRIDDDAKIKAAETFMNELRGG